MDLATLATCSPAELEHPKCPLSLPNESKPIRWVRAVSLLDLKVAFVPAVLVYSNAGYADPAERFWIPISTGCAAHVSYEKALEAGLFEIIERDALSITWLQQLSLPRIEVDMIPEEMLPYWNRYLIGPRDIEIRIYDATTEFGIPTAYGLRVAPFNKRVATIVACATCKSMPSAIAKVVRDLASLSLAFRDEVPIPRSWDDFADLMHGATLLARSTSRVAFDFLSSTGVSRLSDIVQRTPTELSLEYSLSMLWKAGFSAFAVDLSTDEAIRVGIRVVRVIVPQMQPMSFRYRARFLGNPRLYSAPVAMGYTSRSEEELNVWPQPFA